MNNVRLVTLTAMAMVAFAANSLLCRAALRGMRIDAVSFTSIRIISGAIVLWAILRMRRQPARQRSGWNSALALFVYAVAFSVAYIRLSAATGALLLFAAVQTTMIAWGFRKGEKLDSLQWMGLGVAITGLIVLLLPGIARPAVLGSALMLTAGFAWGVYSIQGQTSNDAIGDTGTNFVRAVPLTALLSVAFLPWIHADPAGVSYAVVSGAATSGLGYVIWYSALPHLKATLAATVQLCVPVVTAAGGILFLQEPLTLRFALCAIAVLGGIGLVVFERQH